MKTRHLKKLLMLPGILLILFSCQEAEESDVTGEFGSGSSGTAVSEITTDREITKTDGRVIATYQYDSAFFYELPPAYYESGYFFMVLSDVAREGVVVYFSRIYGRPDTACRYQAALLARDEEFSIDLTGERENSQGIPFYQVELHKGSDYRGLYCADLADNSGVSIGVKATSRLDLSSKQIYFILNSVTL